MDEKQSHIDSDIGAQGEVCSNAARVFVHRPILKSFVERVVEATRALKVGDPMVQCA